MEDDELRHVYRQGTSRAGEKRLGCPGDEDLLGLLTGAATTRERQTLADHLARCSDCAEEYRIARELQPWAAAAADQLAPARGAPQPSAFRTKPHVFRPQRHWLGLLDWRRAAAVAALVVVAAGGVAVWRKMLPPPVSDRGGSSMTLSVQPSNHAILPGAPDLLSWSAVPAAESYQVIMYDFESTPVWESPQVTDPRVSLPAPIRGAIQPNRRYYWRIVVSTGIERRTSDLFQFTVSAR